MNSAFASWQFWAVLSAVFGAVFLGERLGSTNWLGVVLIAVGAVLVAYKI